MDINLKVSPAELEAKATDFKGVMSQIKTLTDDMMADVTGLSSTWTGDASAAYISKFKKLQTDIGVLYPEGNMGDKTQFLFNHEDIEEVISKGYTDETWEDFIKRMREFYKEI